jgi:ATP-dependent RNA helicase DDX49/DBP8
MDTLENVEGLSEVIGRAIQQHLERSNINVAWPQIDGLVRPILRVEAFLEDAGPHNTSSTRSERVASVSTPAPFL